ncbi:uncharacterized protein BJ171DRAFT_493839 [Polychytrium aggregatum]|uniref:uncharacterized protein n=1 Tax=Polychytrium aggregatum TaxID=110093 RepID=UPI0022FDCEFF|nr:uncharacterized protein BJ171DRAFT_493839 [Polychytrium aggregatum]KAI9207189.1 hypothetical protein BJ171DRAFT_493839 [Polychytrium aggregatum]
MSGFEGARFAPSQPPSTPSKPSSLASRQLPNPTDPNPPMPPPVHPTQSWRLSSVDDDDDDESMFDGPGNGQSSSQRSSDGPSPSTPKQPSTHRGPERPSSGDYTFGSRIRSPARNVSTPRRAARGRLRSVSNSSGHVLFPPINMSMVAQASAFGNGGSIARDDDLGLPAAASIDSEPIPTTPPMASLHYIERDGGPSEDMAVDGWWSGQSGDESSFGPPRSSNSRKGLRKTGMKNLSRITQLLEDEMRPFDTEIAYERVVTENIKTQGQPFPSITSLAHRPSLVNLDSDASANDDGTAMSEEICFSPPTVSVPPPTLSSSSSFSYVQLKSPSSQPVQPSRLNPEANFISSTRSAFLEGVPCSPKTMSPIIPFSGVLSPKLDRKGKRKMSCGDEPRFDPYKRHRVTASPVVRNNTPSPRLIHQHLGTPPPMLPIPLAGILPMALNGNGPLFQRSPSWNGTESAFPSTPTKGSSQMGDGDLRLSECSGNSDGRMSIGSQTSGFITGGNGDAGLQVGSDSIMGGPASATPSLESQPLYLQPTAQPTGQVQFVLGLNIQGAQGEFSKMSISK